MNQVYVYEQSHDDRGAAFLAVNLNSEKYARMIYCNWHKGIEFVIIRKGILRLTVNEKSRDFSAGEIAVINREEVHFGNPAIDETCEADVILVDIDRLVPVGDVAVKKDLDALIKKKIILASAVLSENPYYIKILNCLEQMIFAYNNQQKGFGFQAASLIYELLFYFFSSDDLLISAENSLGQDQKKIKKLNEVLLYIEENYTRKIYIAELADHLFMGVDNFYKFFVSVTGVSPVNYINSFRLKQAGRLLKESDFSVTDICYKVGFNNISYFIKTFQRYYNYTPKQYRSLWENPKKEDIL